MKTNNLNFSLDTIEKTKELAHKLACYTVSGDIFCIKGDIGAGKTTFCQFFIQYFLPQIQASSPTFSIVNSYDTKNFTIYHLDLYRIKQSEELLELGLDEILNNSVALIEWSENLHNYFIYNPIYLTFSVKNQMHFIDIDFFNKSQLQRFFPQ